MSGIGRKQRKSLRQDDRHSLATPSTWGIACSNMPVTWRREVLDMANKVWTLPRITRGQPKKVGSPVPNKL